MPRQPHVALLIESSRGYGRGLLHGVADYIRVHGPWSVHLQRHATYDAPPEWLDGWKGDGVIARIENTRVARAIRKLRVPAVDLRDRLKKSSFPTVLTDDFVGARMAAAHLLERGFMYYGYCGYPGTTYSDNRSRVFKEVVERAGFQCQVYTPPSRFIGLHPDDTDQQGRTYEQDISRWLRTLPEPIGIMACNDVRAQQLLNACRDLGIAVPDRIAVLGVDNDEVICDLCDPPLSSVVPNTRKIGYDAAALLDRMMQGELIEPGTFVVPPLGIVTRRSTDVLAIEDPDIADAVRFIRDHACAGITVEDVLQRVTLSASSLERQFRRLLNRTPKTEIIRVQLEHVRRLLAEPGLSLKEIASKTGFRNSEYLCAVFKHKTGQTPGEYRALVQLGRNQRETER
jgi:LacI family transcriptional regulator